jgi:DNA-binding response OmpR family regulator
MKVTQVNGSSDIETYCIMLMDDDPLARLELSTFLTEQGYDIVTCANSIEAKAIWNDHNIDLVISDVFVRADGEFIPHGGVSLVGWLRIRSKVPIIAISGYTKLGDKSGYLQDMREMGANVALPKPVDTQVLLYEVRKLLGARDETQDASMLSP